MFLSKSDRNKAIKLLLKIFENILNHPSQIQKYGDLNAKRIKQKLCKCKPAFNLLFIAGFKESNNRARIIWMNTDKHVNSLLNIHKKLRSIITSDTNDEKQQSMAESQLNICNQSMNKEGAISSDLMKSKKVCISQQTYMYSCPNTKIYTYV